MKRTAISTVFLSFFLGGCFDFGLLQAAADFPFGAKEGMPNVETEVEFPSVSEILTGVAMPEEVPGFPTQLGDGSFAHLQGLFSLTGECRRSVAIPLPGSPERDDCPSIDELSESTDGPQYACMTITNCADDPRCTGYCNGFRGLMLDVSIDVSFISAEQALQAQQEADINFDVGTDAVSQIRLQFSELELYQVENGIEVSNNNRYFDFRFGARTGADAECPGDNLMIEDDRNETDDCIVVVEQKYLDVIKPEDPQRFDLRSSSLFTENLKAAVLAKFLDPNNAPSPRTSLWLKMAISEEQLYELKIEGAGFKINVQPEFVINVLEVAKGQI